MLNNLKKQFLMHLKLASLGLLLILPSESANASAAERYTKCLQQYAGYLEEWTVYPYVPLPQTICPAFEAEMKQIIERGNKELGGALGCSAIPDRCWCQFAIQAVGSPVIGWVANQVTFPNDNKRYRYLCITKPKDEADKAALAALKVKEAADFAKMQACKDNPTATCLKQLEACRRNPEGARCNKWGQAQYSGWSDIRPAIEATLKKQIADCMSSRDAAACKDRVDMCAVDPISLGPYCNQWGDPPTKGFLDVKSEKIDLANQAGSDVAAALAKANQAAEESTTETAPSATPETNAAPDVNATPSAKPDANATPSATPDANATPKATPDANAAASVTPEANANPNTAPAANAAPSAKTAG